MSSLWSKSSRVVIYVKILSYIVKRDTESSDYHTTMLSFEEINSKSIPIAYVGDVEKSSPLHNKVVFLTKPEDVKTREEKRKLEECHQLITGRHETFPETNTLYDFYSEQETKHNLFCKRVAILEGKFYPLPVSQSKTSLTSRVFLSGKPGVAEAAYITSLPLGAFWARTDNQGQDGCKKPNCVHFPYCVNAVLALVRMQMVSPYLMQQLPGSRI